MKIRFLCLIQKKVFHFFFHFKKTYYRERGAKKTREYGDETKIQLRIKLVEFNRANLGVSLCKIPCVRETSNFPRFPRHFLFAFSVPFEGSIAKLFGLKREKEVRASGKSRNWKTFFSQFSNFPRFAHSALTTFLFHFRWVLWIFLARNGWHRWVIINESGEFFWGRMNMAEFYWRFLGEFFCRERYGGLDGKNSRSSR